MSGAVLKFVRGDSMRLRSDRAAKQSRELFTHRIAHTSKCGYGAGATTLTLRAKCLLFLISKTLTQRQRIALHNILHALHFN
ncbi:unnamed protein product [Danaus chrysippus]|uniref:(African queen) hypothetical protein n=1 Tax=Danaus chrysippus TaxID=151541 RepID=A0A8J2RBH8_9NEOP|nr:unnamed protein product [Danaus chrysippus]